ncbi:MAG: LysM peptidoglycan-binding domain-containing protein [Planctomycetes bacterium]|nr:LysM peptidoglycan-binding domain-containing protein [Planctomycetota bacterium]
MNKDVKTGMLIGLGLVIVAVVAISIWPGGTVHQRLRRADGKNVVPPPAEITKRISPPPESDHDHSGSAFQEEMQRVAEHVIEERQQARLEAGPLIHVVAEGETLSHIAQMHYGDANKWIAIAEANKGVLPRVNLLRPGMRLLIPRLDR